MNEHVVYVEQGRCAKCGSYDIKPVTIMGGRPGENIIAFFECEECGCEYIEVYEFTCKGVVEKEEE